MSNARNSRTTHPQIHRRRERALERFYVKDKAPSVGYFDRKDQECSALIRKLSQRKQGSAT